MLYTLLFTIIICRRTINTDSHVGLNLSWPQQQSWHAKILYTIYIRNLLIICQGKSNILAYICNTHSHSREYNPSPHVEWTDINLSHVFASVFLSGRNGIVCVSLFYSGLNKCSSDVTNQGEGQLSNILPYDILRVTLESSMQFNFEYVWFYLSKS